jgi:DNA-directed RNA polymerase specialized sigma subunit
MSGKELPELENIQRLLMLLLFKMGASGDEIAQALGVSKARVSQMMPARKIEPAEMNCVVIGDQYK